MGKFISATEVKEIQKLREEGWSFQKIADKYGITRQGVQQRLYYRHRKRQNNKINDLNNKINMLEGENDKLRQNNIFLRDLLKKNKIDITKVIGGDV